MKVWLGIGALLLALIVGAQFITIFVVQPIGGLPEGRTVVIARLTKLNFIDSADAFCDRTMGGVSLLCRAAVLGKVTKEASILLRLPYSAILYQISTGGKHYDR
ncbi:hypothetical protein G8O24_41055 [Bradyrhizobium sp. INPA01-394B]|uniref:Uncharacterized protein n=1 Tax=Bradyrhizobium campsiandrae TaxID=1729892 RepID=A0ABR7UMI5_9BRAD|nr:hypothetical protein [Bradyrhizobium campsiandrae]MBC9883678.1 hypothetical protein [Bradyrhizobium campsiandrae]MBC9984647.1 hypothetical protein [Bradyrhizobium campsiandrae]